MSIDPVSLAITVALNAASMAINAMRTIEGPRLSDLSVSVADYGTPITRFIGKVRIECPCFFAEPIREEKQQSKGKGGKYKEYNYYGTWASLITDRPIAQIRIVYFDHNQVYSDVDGFNVFDNEGISPDAMRLFNGTEDQVAPDRMIAFVEAEEGPDTCPNYLGVSYIWFEDVPLGNLGNRYPQVSVIVDDAQPFAGWYARARITLVNPSTTLPGLGFYVDPSGPAANLSNVSNGVWPGTSNSEFPDGIPYRVYDAGNQAVTLYWCNPNVLDSTEVDLRLQFPNNSVSDDMKAAFSWEFWDSGPISPSPMTSTSINPGDPSSTLGNPFDVYDLFTGNWYFGIGYSGPLPTDPLPPGAVPTLRTLMDMISEDVGLEADDYDYSAFDQPIDGYAWIQGPAKDIVAPVLDLHDSDVRQSGFTLEGLKRGAAVSGDMLSYSWFVRDGKDPLYTVRNVGDSDIPRRVTATFADMNAEYQPNSAVAQRNLNSVETVREISIDLTTLSSTADDMQPKVERFLRRNWVGALSVSASLSPKEFLLDPGDVKLIEVEDGMVIRGRATRLTRRVNRVMVARFEQDDARPAAGEDPAPSVGVIISSPGAEAIGRPPPAQISLVGTEGFFLDMPLASDVEDQTVPFLYVAAGPMSEQGTWPGSDALQSETGATYNAGWYTFIGANDDSTWGECLTALPDALSTVIDEGSELLVSVPYGELNSITQEELDSNPTANLACIGSAANGWEIIQFRDAVLQSTDAEAKHYLISGLVRGARGTEQVTGTHVVGDRLLMLTGPVKKKNMGAGEIGDTDYYKMASIGFDVDLATVHTVAYQAKTHKPYAPANVELNQNGDTLDWIITWDRRSRIGGNSFIGQDVPLGEASELYHVKVMDGATVVRTIIVTSETATYTQAQQVEDWGGVQSGVSIQVAQVSPTLGLEGFITAAAA